MTDELSRPEQQRPPSRRLTILTVAIVLLSVIVLSVNARTTSIFDDEAGGLFLCSGSLANTVHLLRGNVSEDAPLWDTLLHPWSRLAGYNPGLLRTLPILFWVAMIPGLYLVVRRLADPRAACLATVAVCLMPYHWLLPMAIRWYSLYACLAVWNFFFFLRMMDYSPRFVRAVPYVLTGACLWYTNYSAPVLFFTQFVVAMVRAKDRRRMLIDLALCWAAVTLLFAPWLATFLRQIGASTRPLTVSYTGISLYVLLAGEFSTPLNYWIAAPVAAAAVLLLIIAAAEFRRCWVPMLVVATGTAALLATGAIGPKRLLVISPFLAMTIGIALATPAAGARRLRTVRTGAVAATMLVVAGSLIQMIRREDWAAYRWLDPCREIVASISSQSPQPLIIAASKPVFFYAQAAYGKERCCAGTGNNRDLPKAIWVPTEIDEWRACGAMLRRAERVVWVYHSPYGGPISGCWQKMTREMERYGFRVSKTEPCLELSPALLRFHPRFKHRSSNPLDAHRLVLVYFTKDRAKNSCPIWEGDSPIFPAGKSGQSPTYSWIDTKRGHPLTRKSQRGPDRRRGPLARVAGQRAL